MKISGYEVEFPHQPYGVQLSFMSRVLQTIEHRQNALLEAPTGSGKTLSLLCSALSWQRRLKNEGYSPFPLAALMQCIVPAYEREHSQLVSISMPRHETYECLHLQIHRSLGRAKAR